MVSDNPIVTITREIEKKNNSNVFFFITGNVSITEEVFQITLQQFKARAKIPTLDVIIQSYGGSIDAAYKLVKLFRRNADKYRVWVLNYAKSAATFICLGADEIILMPHAELGPLDAQVPDPRDPTSAKTISALDGFKTLEYLRTYALENFDLFTRVILRKAGMSVPNTLDYSTKFTAVIMNPLYQQVDPLNLGGYRKVLEIGVEYGKRILKTHPTFPKDKADTVLEKLIWGYPSHGFVIDYDELKEMGFNVRLPSEDEAELLKQAEGNLDKNAPPFGFLTEERSIEGEGKHGEKED